MITQTELHGQDLPWQQAVQDCLRDPSELCEALNLDLQQLNWDPQPDFPLRIPRVMLQFMRPGDARDPVLLQVLARTDEQHSAGGKTDPLDEAKFNPLPGLVHKYQNRLLLPVTGACAMHCRYCFRRHFDYAGNRMARENWPALFDYIRRHADLEELILSGGDPLSAPDRLLHELVEKTLQQTQITRIRVHSRLPVFIPQRITNELIDWMQLSKSPVLVLHINHAQELSEPLRKAVQQLNSAGVRVFNQSVLLKDINDRASIQIDLSRRLFDAGIQPYYLHLMDPVQGAMHFEVADQQALAVYSQMRAALPGYMLPSLVREEPGKPSKTRLW